MPEMGIFFRDLIPNLCDRVAFLVQRENIHIWAFFLSFILRI